MKKLIIIFLLLMIPIVAAQWDSVPINLNQLGGVGATEASGWRAIALINMSVKNVTKVVGVGGGTVSIYNDSGFLLNRSNFVGTVAFINATLIQGQAYRFLVNNTNGTGWNHYCARAIDPLPVIGNGAFNWTNGTFNNVTLLQDATYLCNIQRVDFIGNISGLIFSNITLVSNASTYETSSEGFMSNFSSSQSISSANFVYNGTSYSATVTNPETNQFILSRRIDIPLGAYYTPWYWNITYSNGTVVRSENNFQNITIINLTSCSAAPQNIQFINFTFKNETSAQESINASISSSWNYYMGTGAINKTLTYINSSVNPSYAFCFNPPAKVIQTALVFTYSNTESLQRSYSPALLTLTNTTTNTVLYLLPTGLGQLVSFQVKNVGGQLISGATITATSSTFGLVESHVTDASGIATFFLNPLTAYTITASASGYTSSSSVITPSQTTYTITLGATSSGNLPNYAQGVSIDVNPRSGVTLQNNTVYHFNMTINSTTWTFSSFGFVLGNGTFDFKTTTGSGGTSGFADTTLDTGLNKTIVMRYFYIVNGTTINYTASWYVVSTALSSYSLAALGTAAATDLSLGLFGADQFSTGLIVFLVIFIASGVFSYKYGITNPGALLGFTTALVALLDVGFNLIPNPVDAVAHFPTVFMVIATIALMLKGATQ